MSKPWCKLASVQHECPCNVSIWINGVYFKRPFRPDPMMRDTAKPVVSLDNDTTQVQLEYLYKLYSQTLQT